MFGTMLSPFTIGSVWRTQHQLARHYLLALPIRHRRLFAIQQARMLVPWMPLVTLVAMMPLLGVAWPPARPGVWALYYGGLVVSVGLLIQHGLWMALEGERIAAYLPKGARFRAHVKAFVVFGAMWIPLYGAWIKLIVDDRMWTDLPVALVSPHRRCRVPGGADRPGVLGPAQRSPLVRHALG